MEELKLILETIASLGETAKWLYIFWLGKNLLISLIGFGFGFTILVVTYKLSKFAITGASLTWRMLEKAQISRYSSGWKNGLMEIFDRGMKEEEE